MGIAGPDFWWFDHAIKFRGEQSETCTSDWAEKVDNGDYKAWAWCLSNSKPLLDANLVPDAHVKTLIEGMKKQDCKPWQPAEPVAMVSPSSAFAN